MFKKLVYSTLVLITLSGCATHQQSNEAVGAIIGGTIGNRIGGTGGAILGAGMGAAIGGQQPTQRNVIVERQIVHPVSTQPDYGPCQPIWNYYERQSCQRGAEARASQEQNRRIQEAYRQGFGR